MYGTTVPGRHHHIHHHHHHHLKSSTAQAENAHSTRWCTTGKKFKTIFLCITTPLLFVSGRFDDVCAKSKI